MLWLFLFYLFPTAQHYLKDRLCRSFQNLVLGSIRLFKKENGFEFEKTYFIDVGILADQTINSVLTCITFLYCEG